MVLFCYMWHIVANDLQDVSLLVSIFFPCSPLLYTPVGLASLPSSPSNALIPTNVVFSLVGQALASLAGPLAAVAPFKVSVLISLSCRS